MKRIFKKIGFRQMDEMERYIAFKAQRNSYLFLIAALIIWTFYESFQVYTTHSSLNLVPCLLLTSASVIQAFSQLLLTRSAVKDDEDSCETGPLLKLVLLVCAAAGVIATVAAAVVLTGVRT